MSKQPEDWEKQLKEKPFAGKHFTAQMQRNVEQRLGEPAPRKLRSWKYAAALIPLLAIVLVIGYSSGRFSRNIGGSNASGSTASDGTGGVENGTGSNSGPGYNGSKGNNNTSVAPDSSPNGTAENADSGAADNLPATLAFPSADNSAEKVQIPLTSVLAVPNIDDGTAVVKNPLPALPAMTLPLTQDMEDKLQATLVYSANGRDNYLLLAPAGWTASAEIGANGSYGVTYQDPADPLQNLRYTDTNWTCQGCAISDIGLYFPDKAQWAEDNGFPVYVPLEFTRQQLAGSDGADARTVRYTLKPDKDGLLADGAAYYEEGSWGYLVRHLQLTQSSVAPQLEALESIMNFFSASHGALSLPSVHAEAGTADSVPYTADQLLSVLEQQGLKLTAVNAGEEHLFNKELAGVWPDELLIDYEGPLTIPDRLSLYTFGSAEECAEGLADLKLQINRTTYDGGARIYPHAFRGGNFLVVYWKGAGSDGTFQYDKAIKTSLAGFNDAE